MKRHRRGFQRSVAWKKSVLATGMSVRALVCRRWRWQPCSKLHLARSSMAEGWVVCVCSCGFSPRRLAHAHRPSLALSSLKVRMRYTSVSYQKLYSITCVYVQDLCHDRPWPTCKFHRKSIRQTYFITLYIFSNKWFLPDILSQTKQRSWKSVEIELKLSLTSTFSQLKVKLQLLKLLFNQCGSWAQSWIC